jgi:hypothetical protein
MFRKAVTVLKGDSASGTVIFEQSVPFGPVTVTGDLKGLDASALRGFHIQYVVLPMSIYIVHFRDIIFGW